MGLMQFGYNPIPNPVCGKMGLIQSHLRIVGSLATAAAAHESGHETASAAAAAHAGVDALLIALLVASVAFAGAETHGCLW